MCDVTLKTSEIDGHVSSNLFLLGNCLFLCRVCGSTFQLHLQDLRRVTKGCIYFSRNCV